MLAGALRHLIRIETPVETPDGSGGSTSAWTLLFETRASVSPLTGRERLQAAAVQSEVTHMIALRYRAGVTAKCRIVYGSRVFRITAVRDLDERHRELNLDCVEVMGEVP